MKFLTCIFLLLTACTPTTQNSALENVQLGIAYLEDGDVVRAKQHLLLAEKGARYSADVQDGLAYYYEAVGELQAAEKHYQLALQYSPHAGSAHNNYGTYLCRYARYDEAVREFVRAVQEDAYTQTAQAYENAGLCARSKRDKRHYFKLSLQHDSRRAIAKRELEKL